MNKIPITSRGAALEVYHLLQSLVPLFKAIGFVELTELLSPQALQKLFNHPAGTCEVNKIEDLVDGLSNFVLPEEEGSSWACALQVGWALEIAAKVHQIRGLLEGYETLPEERPTFLETAEGVIGHSGHA